jgi:subtilase family serine protease
MVLLNLAAAVLAGDAVHAQVSDHIASAVDTSQTQALVNHHPLWAVPANDAGVVAANQPMENLTLVLARSPEQEQAFKQLLEDQQDAASPSYHKWLTAAEIGESFGLSDNDIASITGWLRSQGLHVNRVAPSRALIAFSGSAGDIGRAFQTELHHYQVHGEQRVSVASDPMIPVALAPAIKAVRGLYTIDERPFHRETRLQSDAPNFTITSGGVTYHFIAPSDFATIYDLPGAVTGAGTTIGIVSEARTNFADFANFRTLTGSTFGNPTEVVPTAFGGVDPGPAYTSPASCNTCGPLDAQGEATLDVLRSGSVAPGASLLSVVASSASGGVGVDAEYLIESTPVPAQVMTISFGACEAEAGGSGVDFWDTLFQQAAGEGISVFVSSGDSGASGCDTGFATPPANPVANSPNYICSSSYATCVGGTEFNDAGNPTSYWNASNGAGLSSALSYIPEGAWNEPLNSESQPQAAASGGGVSAYILTPSWQTGTGVPAARTGRYTPDVAFSGSSHDGYFACFAAGDGSCVSNSGSYPFVVFSGTSADAPAMAGVAALLGQKSGAAIGNINPAIYGMAASTPAAFHPVSVASSGVSNCSAATPSMCNNSAPGPTGLSGGQAGYLLGQTGGYSEVTGLGSLDVTQFIDNYTNSNSSKFTPTVTVSAQPSVTTAQSVSVEITVTGNGSTVPTGSVTISSGSYTSAAEALNIPGPGSNSVFIVIPSGGLALGTDTLTADYTSNSSTYFSAAGSTSITVTPATQTPTVTVTPSSSSITTTQSLQVTVTVSGGSGAPTPTGSVVLKSGTSSTWTATLSGGSASIIISAGVLALGTDTLAATYTPDANGAVTYSSATGSNSVNVTAATKTNPGLTWNPPGAITYGTALGAAQLDATANVPGTFAYSPAAGTVLTAGSQVLTVNFTPTDSTDYATATSIVTLIVNKTAPVVTWPTPAAITYGTALSVTQLDATANTPGTFVYAPGAGFVPFAGQKTLTVTFSPTDTVDYNTAAGSTTLTINKATPVLTWITPAAVSVGTTLSTAQLNATASVPGTFVYNPAAGTVMSTAGSTTLSAAFTPTDSTDNNNATGSVVLVVNAATPSTFSVGGTSVTAAPGANSGNTSTITLTPSGGFTGAVTLSAVVTQSPSGVQDPPTLSFGSTSPVSITGANAVTATLTVTTTAATVGANVLPAHPGSLRLAGGAALACVLLFWLPVRRRDRRNILGLYALLVALACGVSACGGSNSSSSSGGGGGGGGGGNSNPGTTAGSYIITVTGTSGSTSSTTTINLTITSAI